ncbi:type IV secretion system DNA-binding domain-containing protein [bacterium]|nr:type IV secretion system DNA-binding domain-containing protein [bacterium]
MKLIFSIALIAVGTAVGAHHEPPHSWVVLTASITLSFSLMLYRHRKVILRFGKLTWTKEEIVRHVLITGDTGSGKTTSGLHPILHQLTKNMPDWGGLVLGAKGDEHEFISELLQTHGRENDLIHLQVRPSEESTKWKPPHRYNLLSNRSLPWSAHAKAISDIAASMTEGQQHAFFRPMAQMAMANSFELLDELGEIVTLSKAHDVLTSKSNTEKRVKQLKRLPSNTRRLALVDFFETNFTKARAHEQTEAVTATVKTYLGFFLDPDVAAVFSSEEPNTFSLAEVERGVVITVTMPQRFVIERRYIQTYLKILFFYHALSRFDLSKEEFKNRNTLFFVADEFQTMVTATEDGISDHNVIDRIRSAGVGIIAAMQSEISADPVVGERKRRVLTLNMRTRFVFRGADLEGANASADHIGKREFWKSTKTSRPLKPVTYSRRKEQEHFIKAAQLMRLGDHTAVVVHPSKRYIKKKIIPLNGAGRPYKWF